MSNTVSETVHAAENGLGAAKDRTLEALNSAKEHAVSAKESTSQGVASAIAMVAKGISATVGVVAMLQKLDRDDGLAWLGLARRRSPLYTVLVAGAGVAFGVGAALLFAPMSGAELRGMIMGGAKGAVKKVEAEVVAEAGKLATEAGKLATEAGKVGTTAKGVKSELSPSHSATDSTAHNGGPSRT